MTIPIIDLRAALNGLKEDALHLYRPLDEDAGKRERDDIERCRREVRTQVHALSAALDELEQAREENECLDRALEESERMVRNRDEVLVDVRAERDRLRAQVKELSEALNETRQAGEGFMRAIRETSGLAYPWPAWELAEEAARAALRKAGGK
ncbi:MAG: hypothetical protein FJ298_14275 [Planctomycetes bacterium]|nr:hypothetical protein [Planctomycetota bacterium]